MFLGGWGDWLIDRKCRTGVWKAATHVKVSSQSANSKCEPSIPEHHHSMSSSVLTQNSLIVLSMGIILGKFLKSYQSFPFWSLNRVFQRPQWQLRLIPVISLPIPYQYFTIITRYLITRIIWSESFGWSILWWLVLCCVLLEKQHWVTLLKQRLVTNNSNAICCVGMWRTRSLEENKLIFIWLHWTF